ncbi:hypothetical protein AVEN_215869-1 [Araneus ventricosus]|uniref:Uncharacterized protein n=1 Tax=Araneus ventricosus TaxID=182803 RepID=A0A4Y2N1X9_ARAVE|nr:hypothetical protein AVEN_215869-1 [Araneus ventricosus]
MTTLESKLRSDILQMEALNRGKGGDACIGASEKLGPSHGSSEKNLHSNLAVASKEDLETEWERVEL